ncbi:MAG: hypothetical protein IPL49_03610 [Saprospirales bacterium]|nr:hypothetical protein [Saprospirales bacterium]
MDEASFASATLLDFNFDDPDSYENEGKYPVMFSFGCKSGEMFNPSRGLGERFILAEQKGMIALFLPWVWIYLFLKWLWHEFLRKSWR